MVIHAQRVGFVAATLSRVLGLDRLQSRQIVQAAWAHDVGKNALPPEILNKAGALERHERDVVRRHPVLGAQMLTRQGLTLAAEVALQHHELWDGSGYPAGLKGEAISYAARIVTICDVYAALREQRSYKPGLSHEAALETMRQGGASGEARPGIFDPKLLEIFLKHEQEFDATIARLPALLPGCAARA